MTDIEIKSVNTTQSNIKEIESQISEDDTRPYCMSTIIAKYPLLTMLVCLITMIVTSIVGVNTFTIQLGPPRGRSPYAIEGDIRTQRIDSLFFAQREVKLESEQDIGSAFDVDTILIFIYIASDGGNLLTPERIQAIHNFEMEYFNYDGPAVNDSYSDWCWTCPSFDPIPATCIGGQQCRPIFSAYNYFYPSTYNGTVVYDGFGRTMADINVTLDYLSSNSSLDFNNPFSNTFFFGKEFTAESRYSSILRSRVAFGLPIPGYLNQDDRSILQDDIINEFVVSTKGPILDKGVNDLASVGIELVYFGGKGLINEFISEFMVSDGQLAFFSFIFVLLFIWYHSGSFFMAGMGMFHIVMSFPMAIFVSAVLFQVYYFDILNMFLLFIILGVGADDIFVYVDLWKQSFYVAPHWDDVTRVSYVWRRAYKAMFVTSFTTAFSFLSNISSPFMPSKSFAYFAFGLITVNYLLVCTWFPCVVVVYKRYFEKNCVYSPYCKRGCSVFPCCPKSTEAQKVPDSESSDAKGSLDIDTALTYSSPLIIFFVKTWYPFLLKAKKVLLACSVLFALIFVGLASTISEATEEPSVLPKDSMPQKFIDYSSNSFLRSADSIQVHLTMVWGVNPIPDRQGHSIFEFQSKACNEGACGTVVWDDSFSFSTEAHQMHMVTACDTMMDAEWTVSLFSCWIYDFRSYITTKGGTFPVPPANLPDELRLFFATTAAFNQHILSKSVFFEPDTGTLKFVSMTVGIPFTPGRFYLEKTTNPAYNEYTSIMNELNAAGPDGMDMCFFTTRATEGLFTLSYATSQYTVGATRGLLLSLAMAFCVLIISCVNWWLGTLAFVNICSVVALVVGMMVALGWEIGAFEAICLSLVVGFSVDYIVHLANAYIEAPVYENTRELRVRRALFDMGSSVFGGALTTLGSSFFLLFCVLTFFSLFGMFIFMTICFAAYVAYVQFLAMLLVFGPENKQGDLTPLYMWITSPCRKAKN